MLKYSLLFLIILFFLALHLVNLTILPIFNDEAIYLHWGIISIDKPGELFYSLFDGKQPLLMWVYGLSQNYFTDPLFAGRFISVILGLFTLIGIFLIAKRIANEKTALIAIFIYTIIPIFVFYNRQALMEAAIAACGIWAFYLFIKIIDAKNKYFYSILLGITVGVSLFIKASALVFLVPLTLFIIFEVKRHKNINERSKLINSAVIAFVVSQVIVLPLYFQKDFVNIYKLSARYTYTFNELFHFPVTNWIQNFTATAEILFWYITPVIFIFSIFGIIKLWLKEESLGKYLIIWFLIPLVIFILTVKTPSTRYIVSLLPLVSIFFAYGINSLRKGFQLPILIVSVIIPLFLVFVLLVFPLKYFHILDKFTDYTDTAYISGWTSGYGVKEAVEYIEGDVENRAKVYTLLSVGNPDDAVFVYLNKNNSIRAEYLWTNECSEKLMNKFSREKDQIYFVSRDYNASSILDCFKEEKRFYKPTGESFVGVYIYSSNDLKTK